MEFCGIFNFSVCLVCLISDSSAGTISAREAVNPHIRASDSSRGIATLFDVDTMVSQTNGADFNN